MRDYNKQFMNRSRTIHDSLVYSEGIVEEEENLLQDSTELAESNFGFQKVKIDPPTIKIQKNAKMNASEIELNNSSLAKYLMNDSEVRKQNYSSKSFRKLEKDKQKFLALDPKIQSISLKSIPKYQKINELLNLIETQKVQKYVKRLRQYEAELQELANQVINQRKHLQREIENIIEMNKLMKIKLKEIQKYLEETRHQKIKGCTCQHDFSFSKSKQSPINYLDRFQFAKTIISSIEELELKKVEQQEDLFDAGEMAFVELIWSFKNKVQDKNFRVSQGLIDRVATGPTLKGWIKKIDEKISGSPKTSCFQISQQQKIEDSVLKSFIETLKAEEQSLMQNIKRSKDRSRELEVIKNSATMTFLQILHDEFKLYSKDEAVAYFGEMNRCLTLIEKKSALSCPSELVPCKDFIDHIEALYS